MPPDVDPYAALGLSSPTAAPPPEVPAPPAVPVATTSPSGARRLTLTVKPGEDGGEIETAAEKPADVDPYAALGLEAPKPSALPAAPEGPGVGVAPAVTLPEQPAAHRFLGGLASAIEGIPRGIVGDKAVDYTNAAIGTLPGMIYGQPQGQAQAEAPISGAKPPESGFRLQGPGNAFQQALDVSRANHADIAGAYPMSNVGGQVGGALATGIAAAPSLAYRAPVLAANFAPRVAGMAKAITSYLGRNAAFGAGTNALAGGDPLTGAEIGAGAAAIIPPAVKAIAAPIKALGKLAPLVSPAAREAANARMLAPHVNPAAIESSPVGPLTLAQATNSPEIAARGDIAPSFNATANATMLKAQQDAVERQAVKIGAPSTIPDASSAFTGAARAGRGVAGKEETRLWTVPKLTATPVTPTPIQESVGKTMAGMEPVYRDAMSAQLKGLVGRLNRSGTTTVRDLNGIRSKLESVARNSLDGAERAQARELSDAFMEGMDRVPELGGAPGGVLTGRNTIQRTADTMTPTGAPQKGFLREAPEMSGPIAADKEIAKAYQSARDYTRQMRTLFGDPQLATILKRAQGVYARDPSEGARLFFNFSNGSPEGPQSIAQLADFIDTLEAQPGSGAIATQLRDSARSYVAAALSHASRLGEGQAFNPKLMQQFLGRNMDWMVKSGLFERPQIEAAQQLLEYAQMLRRPEDLLRQVNSATQYRQERAKSFIAEVMSPWVRRLGELTLTAAAAHEHGGLGGAIGLVASQGFEHAVARTETAMRTMMAAALLDSAQAKQMLMKQGNQAFISPAMRELLGQLRLAVGSDVAPHMVGTQMPPPQRRLEAPLQMSR